MNVKTVQLRSFAVLAEELHFGRAAERLHVSQPPFSRQIQALERELGVALLRRTSQRVVLTPAGAVFHAELKKVFAALEEAARRARGVAAGEAGRLVVGMTGSISFGIAPRILQSFRQSFPGVQVEIQHQTKAQQIEGVLQRRLTVGFTRSMVTLEDVVSEPLHKEPFLVALHESHPLSACQEVSLRDLADDQFILYRGNSWPSVADEIIGLCTGSGFSPKVGQETDEMQTAVSLVAAGLGVAVVAESISRLLLPGVTYRTLTTAGPERPQTTLYLIYRKAGEDAVLSRFIGLARTVAQEAGRMEASPTTTQAVESPGSVDRSLRIRDG